MTLEEFSATTQDEFENIRREMATKEELRSTETNILRAIAGLQQQFSSYFSYWGEHLETLDRRVQAVYTRLKALEE